MHPDSPSPARFCFALATLLGGRRVSAGAGNLLNGKRQLSSGVQRIPQPPGCAGKCDPRALADCRDLCHSLAKHTLVTEDITCSLLLYSPAKKLWSWSLGWPALHEPIHIHVCIYMNTNLISVYTWWEWGNHDQHVCLHKACEAITRVPDE